ncbi:MAG: alpha/beta fold hydrolase [Nanoarchaeota archaeon]
MNFIIIHGVYSSPDGNWFPWLKKKMETKGYDTIVPKFPTPLNQTLESWLRIIKKHEDKINEETVLIGHSLGAAFILNYLEQSDKKVNSVFLVAGFHKQLGSPYDKILETFTDKKFDWKKIKNGCKKFFVIASDNDEYITVDVSKELAKYVGAELRIIPQGGHLNKEAGFTKFPLLLDLISKSTLKK